MRKIVLISVLHNVYQHRYCLLFIFFRLLKRTSLVDSEFNMEGYRLSCLLASKFSFIEFLPNSTTVFLTLCEPTGILIKIPDAGPPINRQNVGTIEGTKGVQSLKKYLGKIWYIWNIDIACSWTGNHGSMLILHLKKGWK